MGKWILSIVVIGAAAGLFIGYTQPAYDQVKVLQGKVAEYNQALDKAAELQKRKQELLSKLNSFDPNDIDRLHKLLPDHVDNVRLVLDLDTLASKHGLALQNVAISAPESGAGEADSGRGTIAATPTIGPDTRKYDSLTLKFGTESTYPEFLEFLAALEDSLRIVDVEALSISAASAVAAGGEPTYHFDIDMRTYWLK